MVGMVDLAQSRVVRFVDMPARHMANGGESRDVLRGQLATGETVALHGSMQVAGMAPNPAHPIQHSEFILVQEGTLEFRHDDKVEQAGPGSVIYVAKGTVHAVRNIGDSAAKYMVVAVGGDVKP
jgi:quercetin dioxygenase-like cupin family protein